MKHAPGVLCIITGGNTPRGRERIGQTVELVKLMHKGEIYQTDPTSGMQYLGALSGGSIPGWLVKGKHVCSEDYYEANRDYCFYQQKYLMPISDPNQDSEFKNETYKVELTVSGQKIEGYAPDVGIRLP